MSFFPRSRRVRVFGKNITRMTWPTQGECTFYTFVWIFTGLSNSECRFPLSKYRYQFRSCIDVSIMYRSVLIVFIRVVSATKAVFCRSQCTRYGKMIHGRAHYTRINSRERFFFFSKFRYKNVYKHNGLLATTVSMKQFIKEKKSIRIIIRINSTGVTSAPRETPLSFAEP